MEGAVSALLKRAPLFLFAAALLLAAFAGGLYVALHKVFPYDILSSARKTFSAAVETNLHDPDRDTSREFVDVPPGQAAARRFEFIGSDRLTDPILVPGGGGGTFGSTVLVTWAVLRWSTPAAAKSGMPGRIARRSWRNGWRRRSSPKISRMSTPSGSLSSTIRT